MELLWIGHAGILVRYGDVMVAVDPFLSGTFTWKGKTELYQGKSPWIGSTDKLNAFLDRFGSQIAAICITHEHGDHFDPEAIAAILARNPSARVIAPPPVKKWYKKNAGPRTPQPRVEVVRRGKKFDIEGKKTTLRVQILPDTKFRFVLYPQRVGYVISPANSPGVAHLGDSHGIGPGWKPFQDKISDIVSWIKENPMQFVSYYERSSTLKRVWWIHWEPFTPGDFSCGKDPASLIQTMKTSRVASSVLSYEAWENIGTKA
nr:MBL fold metallo-hydrolase [Candidatus Sigynarchaeota archaeon]